MNKSAQTALIAGLISSMPLIAHSQEKVTLVYRATKGQVVRYKGNMNLNFEAMGQKFEIGQKQIEKMTIADVSKDGNITQESITESSDVTYNGQKGPSDEDKSVTTYVFKPDGTLVSHHSDGEKDPTHLSVRLHGALNPIFSSKPVGTGDKWSAEVKSDDTLGTVNAHLEYEVLGFEKLNGIDVVKIRGSYLESSGSMALSVKSIFYVEKSSGDSIQTESDMDNLAPGGSDGPSGKGTLKIERSEGVIFTGTVPTTGAKPTPEKPGKPKKNDGKGKKDDKTKAVEVPKPADPPKKEEPKKEEPKKEKTIDEIVKDYEKVPGLFTLYKKKESGRETIYMEIKNDQLDKYHLLQATASTGTSGRVVAGNPLNDIIFKLSKMQDDKLYFVVPNLAFRAKENTPISRSLKRSFPDAYLESFKIEAKQDDRKSVLINVSDFFKGDIAQIGQNFATGGAPYGVDRDKTYVSAWKNFPENLTVETQYHFAGSGRAFAGSDQLADPRSIPLKVVYNIFELKDNGYKPRLADARIGFFTTDYQSFDDDTKADTTKRYIQRWNVEKADPKAAMSKPKKPIVFWLDNAIPVEYRKPVEEGLLMWNKAFEKVGIQDAIQVKQMPDNADWDTADMRYNVIRWVSSPDAGYAVALFRSNPITGEIVNASITVDSNFTRYIKLEKKTEVDPGTYWKWAERKPDPLMFKSSAFCQYGEGMRDDAWLGYQAIQMAAGPDLGITNEEYMHQYLREVVCHEMGHVMGLRHNFIGSTFHDAKELADPAVLGQTGVTATVMEYGPFNLYAIKHKDVPFYSSTVGPYDLWAMEYGYRNFDAKTTDGEVTDLKKIASRTNEPGLAYQSDEQADSFDPAVTRFDLGKDSIDYWDRYLALCSQLMSNLGSRLPAQGDSYVDFTRGFNQSLGLSSRAGSQIARYIGGLHFNRNFKGDSGQKPLLEPIDVVTQKRALGLIAKYFLAENPFQIPKEYLVNLTTDPYNFLAGYQTFPVKDQITGIQKSALTYLLAPSTIGRISNNEFKARTPKDALQLPEVFTTVRKAVWSELAATKNIGVLHRDLQRAHIESIATLALNGGGSEDAKMLAWNELAEIKHALVKATAPTAIASNDTYTKLHLNDCLRRVNRVLDAKLTISTGGSGGRTLTLADLLGATGEAEGNK